MRRIKRTSAHLDRKDEKRGCMELDQGEEETGSVWVENYGRY